MTYSGVLVTLVRRFGRVLTLPRMGSLSSVPKILNDDIQDSDVRLPENISRNELLQLCKMQPKVQPMIKRTFRRRGVSNSDRQFRKYYSTPQGCTLATPDSLRVRVLQWNVLSQALGVWNDNFVKCPPEALDWQSRRFLIVEEIVEYCPDVVCLQEVDHFNFLKHILGTQGYQGLFFPKPDSPCFYIEGNNGPDGCAIFYKRDKFDLVRAETRVLEIWRVQSNQVALMLILRDKQTGKEICVTTTHLKARKSALLSALRNEQGKDLLCFVNSNAKSMPVILCGDFNAEPIEPVYNTIVNGKLGLSSAYADCDNTSHKDSANREPPYTTWKIREEGEICHTLDYIFYSKNKLEVSAVLDLPSGEEIGENRLPSLSYPSDHFSLVCDLNVK